MATVRTDIAFDSYRSVHPAREPLPATWEPPPGTGDALKQMTTADGLSIWCDGPLGEDSHRPKADYAALPEEIRSSDIQLWVIRQRDVAVAPEYCPFGATLTKKSVKHTNLTGGAPAHCGGELYWVDRGTVLLSGGSGRYPPRKPEQLRAAAQAFRDSGYGVWYIPVDPDAGKLHHLSAMIEPEWIG